MAEPARDEVQLWLWEPPAAPIGPPSPFTARRRQQRRSDAAMSTLVPRAVAVLGATIDIATGLALAGARERSELHDAAEADVIAWLDAAERDARAVIDAARAEAERTTRGAVDARRMLIGHARREAEQRVASADALALEYLAEADAESARIVARAEECLVEADEEAARIVARAEECLVEADEEAARIVARAEDEASRVRDEARNALERSLADGDHERARRVALAHDEIVRRRAEADQSIQAEADDILSSARAEAAAIVTEASDHVREARRAADDERARAGHDAMVVRAEAAALAAQRIEESDRKAAEILATARAARQRDPRAAATPRTAPVAATSPTGERVAEPFIGSAIRRGEAFDALPVLATADVAPRRRRLLSRLLVRSR